MTDGIWDKETGKQLAWIADGRDVFSITTRKKIATVRDGNLYSLTGESLNLHLEQLENSQPGGEKPDALAKFRKLVSD